MERNDDLTNSTGSTGGLGNSSASPSFGSTGSTGSGMGAGSGIGSGSGMGAGSGTGSGASDASSRVQNAKDIAADKLGQAKSAVSSGLGTVKDKASTLNASLADKLEAGANKLRQSGSGSGSPYAPSTGIDGSAALSSDQGMGQLGTKAADALQGTANFLREGDLKASIEEQVRTNPARTLLVALGVGYVLGKALRNNR